MIQILVDELKLQGFTKKTQKAYLYHVEKFIDSKKSKRDYLLELTNQQKSPQSIRLALAAITFYEREVLKQKSEFVFIPKKQSKIPEVLTKQQIQFLINATDNEKHKIIVELLYSSGLRLQELVNLKHEHIDFENNIIIVKQGKGQKDRLTIVSQRVLDILDKQGAGYVLKGRKGTYSQKSVQMVLSKLARKANLKAKVTPHVL